MVILWRKYRRRLLLILFGIVLSLLIVEGGLRIISLFTPNQLAEDIKGLTDYTIQDEELKVRVQPNAPGHDAWGFRNDLVPDSVDIVAIGDSQTWGINAERQDAWPQQLQEMSGQSVYNMALGYYGAVQYWVLLEEALKLDPEIILIGLYFGNDILGAYNTVYQMDNYSEFRDPVTEAVFGPDTVEEEYQEIRNAINEELSWIENSAITKVASFVKHHSLLVQLVWSVYENLSDLRFKTSANWAEANPEDGVIYTNGDVRMVLQPSYRLLAIDLENPRVLEGLRITKELLDLSCSEAEDSGAKLVVVLIPTQELASSDAIRNVGIELIDSYVELIANETEARNDILEYCEQREIGCVDTLPLLKAAIDSNEKVYPEKADGHPMGPGYFLIAESVYQYLLDNYLIKPGN